MAPIRSENKEVKVRTTGGVARKTLLVSIALTILLTFLLTLVEVWSGVWRGNGRGFISTLTSSSTMENSSLCESGHRALIYNKSPKTASTFIQAVLVNWTVETKQPLYQCFLTPMHAMVNIRSCMPAKPDPCGVFSSHVFLNQYTSDLFQDRFPNYLSLTSTRYPAHRIVSMFLFTRKLRDDDPNVERGLIWYLRNLNPWGLYNYQTGEYRSGTCPLTEPEVRRVWSAVMKFDIVIDANAFRASNAILKHHHLFSLPNITSLRERHKERGAVRVNITDEIRSLLEEKVCVETELHRALQFKMAHLYEEATGETCFFDLKLSSLDTCIHREEAETLKDYWKL